MGFVDRGGGREAKGTSLRRSKKNPGAPTTKNKSAHKTYTTPTTRATPTPPVACVAALHQLATAGPTGLAGVYQRACAATTAGTVPGSSSTNNNSNVDTAVALLSRKLQDDQEGMMRRAVEEGRLAAALCWSNEVEKQAVLLDTCMQHNKLRRSADVDAVAADANTAAAASTSATRHVRFLDDVPATASPVTTTSSHSVKPGEGGGGVALYAILGIHVNSIDRVHMRLHEQWVKELEENVKHGDVVGVLSGLNLSRDHGTHYAQERLMRECWRVAAATRLPLVLHLYAADNTALTETVNKAAELLQELLHQAATNDGNSDNNSNSPSAVVLYNGLAVLQASTAMQQLVRTHRPGAGVGFYALVTAEGLVARPAATAEAAAAGDDGADGKTSASASAEQLSALLPSPALNRSCHADGDDKDKDDDDDDAVLLLTQLLIGTGAPWGTPQNLPDPYLCSLPNEPGNYQYVVATVLEAMQRAHAAATADPVQGDGVVVTSAEALAAVVHLNQLRVFFHECIADATTAAIAKASTNEGDEDAQRQREWAALQQPAPATVVAGLRDAKAKADLEALLAEAAKERERVEQERQREEAARVQARNEELQEKRSKRAPKKNVKANNRSNFTHFRNKDFAPRQSKPERLAHQRALEGCVDGDGSDSSNDAEEGQEQAHDHSHHHQSSGKGADRQRRSASCLSSSSSAPDNDDDDNSNSSEDSAGSDNNATAAGSLAAEVEELLKEAEAMRGGRATTGGKGSAARKGKNAKDAPGPSSPPPPTAAASTKGPQGKRATKYQRKAAAAAAADAHKARADSSNSSGGSDDDEDSNNDSSRFATSGASSRRQRKRQQKRQQQQQSRGDNRGSDDDE
jgi:Tat protein secretion system quality control protein TatD with DNase activity